MTVNIIGMGRIAFVFMQTNLYIQCTISEFIGHTETHRHMLAPNDSIIWYGDIFGRGRKIIEQLWNETDTNIRGINTQTHSHTIQLVSMFSHFSLSISLSLPCSV